MPSTSYPATTERMAFDYGSRALASVITAAGDYPDQQGGTFAAGGTAGLVPRSFYIDTSLLTPAPTKMRLLVAAFVNDVAPARTLTVGLYPVGTPSGITNIINPNIGTVVSGSTCAFASPAANSKSTVVNSGDFAVPATGFYLPGLNASGAMVANSIVAFWIRLEWRYV